MNIQESNKLIAEFMGGTFNRVYENTWHFPTPPEFEGTYGWIRLHYHESWEWIMRVIEKIGGLRVKSAASYNPDLMFKIEIVNGYTEIKGTGTNIFFNSSVEGSMLGATYKAAVSFIQW